MALYNTLSEAEREKVPQVLRAWLRYRSEKYLAMTARRLEVASGHDQRTRIETTSTDCRQFTNWAGYNVTESLRFSAVLR